MPGLHPRVYTAVPSASKVPISQRARRRQPQLSEGRQARVPRGLPMRCHLGCHHSAPRAPRSRWPKWACCAAALAENGQCAFPNQKHNPNSPSKNSFGLADSGPTGPLDSAGIRATIRRIWSGIPAGCRHDQNGATIGLQGNRFRAGPAGLSAGTGNRRPDIS
jgi:hypothetical protein